MDRSLSEELKRINYITEKGFEMPTIEDLYQKKLQRFKFLRPDIRETESNILINLFRNDAAEEYDTLLYGVLSFNQLGVMTATGAALNSITMSKANMTWLPARKAVGTITVNAKIGTIIKQAWGIETKSGIKFVTLNNEQIETTTEETDIAVIALTGGKDGNVSAGSITEQTDIINGVNSITNKVGTIGGDDKETDTGLRERYLKFIREPASFTTTGIRNHILKTTNVKKCQVIENETDLPNLLGIPAHSYEPVCYGDTDGNILEELYRYKIAGIRTHGDITRNFGDITVGFSRPTEKRLYFDIIVRAIKGIWVVDFEKAIKDIIIDYVGGLEPQGTVYLYKILGEVYKSTEGITSIGIRIGDRQGLTIENDYQLGPKEIATIIEGDIKISTVVI